MTRRVSTAHRELLETRARAALANNPRISPRQLSEETGMSIAVACEWLNANQVRL